MAADYYIVLNPSAGTALSLGITGKVLRERFLRAGFSVEIDDDENDPLPSRINKALESSAPIIVAAGGDGTVTALSEAIIGTDKTLAILPVGTANLLARDLGIALDIDLWFEQLNHMQTIRIDAGEVNGRIFLHKVFIGLMPAIVAGREQLRGKKGPRYALGFARYFFRRLMRSRRFAIEIETENRNRRIERVHAVAVGNNIYTEGLGRILSRERLDEGILGLYVIKQVSLGTFFRVAGEMLIGRWHNDQALVFERVHAVTLRARKRQVKVMFDGEVETLSTPLNFQIRPGVLPVLVPQRTEASVTPLLSGII